MQARSQEIASDWGSNLGMGHCINNFNHELVMGLKMLVKLKA